MYLLLIGGGEIGAQKSDGTYRPLETLAIDEYFVKKINKTTPKILFIPTAIEQLDPDHLYEEGFKRLYEGKLGCIVDSLSSKEMETKENITDFLKGYDAFYISGGDTQYMLDQWKKTGFDKILKTLLIEDKPIAGISAGAMCWFENVLTEDKDKKLTFIPGLNLFKNTCIPHWNKFKDFFLNAELSKKTPFIAIEDCCAIEITNDSVQLIKSKDQSSAYFYDTGTSEMPVAVTKDIFNI